MNKLSTLVGSLATLLLIVSCGGGGDGGGGGGGDTASSSDGTVVDTSAGLWAGTTSDNRTITGLILPDGSYHLLYSRAGNPDVITGFLQGTAARTGSGLSSSDGKDFNLEGPGVQAAMLAATYTTRQSLSVNITYPSAASTTFTGSYDVAYDAKPSLADAAGTYTGLADLSVGSLSSTVVVSSTGALSGGSGGCTLAGSLSPRRDGNAYDVTFTFGPAPCFFATKTFTGVGYIALATKRLHLVTTNSDRSAGTLFIGSKP